MTITLSGPFKLPMSNQKPDKLVIFLHGVGSDGLDLINLADEIEETLPNAVFLSPNAPFPHDVYTGYQWFSLSDYDDDKLFQGVQVALPILRNYIDENLAKYKLSYKDLVLLGFSQGSMMAIQTALRLPESCFAVICFSGALVKPSALATEMKSKQPMFIAHGSADQVVPATQHRLTVRTLKNMDIEVEDHLIEGLGHTISLEGLELAQAFLKKRLPKA